MRVDLDAVRRVAEGGAADESVPVTRRLLGKMLDMIDEVDAPCSYEPLDLVPYRMRAGSARR